MVSGQQQIIIFCSFNTLLILFLNFFFLKFLSFTGVICKGIQETWILDSTLWIPDFLSVDFGLRKRIVDGIRDSLSCFPDSKDQDSGCHTHHKHKFPGSRIPINGAIYKSVDKYGTLSDCYIAEVKATSKT